MPALDYDYDYYEYRNGRRVGSSVPQRKATTSTNRTYNTSKPATARRNTISTAKTAVTKKPGMQVAKTAIKKQNEVGRKVVVQKKATIKKKINAEAKSQNVKKSKIDIPLEASKKIANKPEAMTLNEPRTQVKSNVSFVSQLRRLALVSVFFSLFFVICYRYSVINEQFSSIKKLKAELVTMQTVNEQIQADIESKTDLTFVENYAKYQLGMQKPTASQIQYVQVDKQDKITTPVSINEVEEKNWFEKMISEIRKFID